MIIIGNGQIAKQFKSIGQKKKLVIFASGVSNSSCTDRAPFTRERHLLLETIKQFSDHKVVYFSSCYLSQRDIMDVPYYGHKRNMEKLVKSSTDNYLILRVPQLFAYPKLHPTLVHFLYFSIIQNQEFLLNDLASRYLLDVVDLPLILCDLLHLNNEILDIANPYSYTVMELVETIEKITSKKAIYKTYSQPDCYDINLSALDLVSKKSRSILSGKGYFQEKMAVYHEAYSQHNNTSGCFT